MLKVGDYVRTKYGIAKVISTKVKDEDDNNVLQVDKMLEPYFCDGCDRFLCDPKDVIKSNPNIIDLIENKDQITYRIHGDIYYGTVESERVFGKYIIGIWYDKEFIELKDLDIVSIVTHEQFESRQYKVGENQC